MHFNILGFIIMTILNTSLGSKEKKPCSNACGANTICELIDDVPTCSCQNGYFGDPFMGCRHECEHDRDCNFKDMCRNFECVDACVQCLKHTTCITAFDHRAVCKCPKGYIGGGFRTCIPNGCFDDSDCDGAVCSSGVCKDDCDGACGLGADCDLHFSIPVCSCPSNTTGDPFVRCVYFNEEQPCRIPCGDNTICESIDDLPICSCQNGYVGDPYVGCRHECEHDRDCNFKDMCRNFKCVDACLDDSNCPDGRSICSSGICKNVCDGTCGLGADCNLHFSNPVCSCPSNTTGDPFVRCVYLNKDEIKPIPIVDSRHNITRLPGNELNPKVAVINWPEGITLFVVVFMFLTIIYLCVREKRKSKHLAELKAAGLFYFEKGALNQINPTLTFDEQADLLPYDRRFEFPRNKLKLGMQLGAGAFGVVFKAYAEGIKPNEKETVVAVKMVKSDAQNDVLKSLVSELKIMIHLGQHLNVVNLLGAVTKNIVKRELMVIVEYCHYGNLRSFLLDNRDRFINQLDPNTGKIDNAAIKQQVLHPNVLNQNIANRLSGCSNLSDVSAAQSNSNKQQAKEIIGMSHVAEDGPSKNYIIPDPYTKSHSCKEITISTADLLSWAFQLASGMEYLSSMNVLHGDLAARNILLCKDYIVKICDFGLARSLYKCENYKKQGEALLPVKWLALESLSDHVFSTYTDVWSFGIVLWELFSLATVPYPNIHSYHQLYEMLKSGYRMEKPHYANDDIYNIMLECWYSSPKTRPLFNVLKEKFAVILGDEVANHYYVLNDPYMKANLENTNLKDCLSMMGSGDEMAPLPPRYVNIPKQDQSTNYYLPMSSSNNSDDCSTTYPEEIA